MTRARRAALAAMPAALVVATATGCTGGAGTSASASPSVTRTGTPVQQRWQRGEFTTDRRPCAAITPSVLRDLGLESLGPPDACRWTSADDDAPMKRTLDVRTVRYEPPAARPHHTATEEARHEFIKPDRWRYGEGTPISGYGDQAKLSATVGGITWGHTVRMAVRVRNVIITAALSAEPSTYAEELWACCACRR